MSNREIALNIVNSFSDEQISAFITMFASENFKTMVETEKIANDTSRKRYSNFQEVMEDIFADE